MSTSHSFTRARHLHGHGDVDQRRERRLGVLPRDGQRAADPADAIAGCRATPAHVNAGSRSRSTRNVVQDQSRPPNRRLTFGDGEPTRHHAPGLATRTGRRARTRSTITVTNAYGYRHLHDSGHRRRLVLLDDHGAQRGRTSATAPRTLTAEARSRLDENIEILRRCPYICVNINGLLGRPGERRGCGSRSTAPTRSARTTSQMGIDASRLRPSAAVCDPYANPKEDPGPGDSRARRAVSIPTMCGM